MVPVARLERWVANFAARHGGPPQASLATSGLVLSAPDGAKAELEPVAPGWQHELADALPLPIALGRLEAHCRQDRALGIILVRRGSYAVAAARGERIDGSKVGSRYVQSRTAAGGWSQQRFARRRSNQAADLVAAVADQCLAILMPRMPLEFLVTGGDRPLVRDVLRHPRLAPLAALPVADHLAIGDPRTATVKAAAEHAASIRATVNDALTEPGG